MSRDSRETPFRDLSRGVTCSEISPCDEMVGDSGLDRFRPLESVIPYILCSKSLLSRIKSQSPYMCLFLSIYR